MSIERDNAVNLARWAKGQEVRRAEARGYARAIADAAKIAREFPTKNGMVGGGYVAAAIEALLKQEPRP